MQARSAKAEAKRLQEKVFPEYVIGVMHSKLKDTEKERVMEEFKDGKIVKESATKNQKLLTIILDTDKGSRNIGESCPGRSSD